MLNAGELLFIVVLATIGIVKAWSLTRLSYGALYERTDFRPLNCDICLSFWFGMVIAYILCYDLKLSIIIGFCSLAMMYIIKLVEG